MACCSDTGPSSCASRMTGTMSPFGASTAMPRFTPACSVNVPASTSIEALSRGCSWRARIVAWARNASGEIDTPCRSRAVSRTRARRAMIRVTSASTAEVNCAVVCRLSVMR